MRAGDPNLQKRPVNRRTPAAVRAHGRKRELGVEQPTHGGPAEAGQQSEYLAGVRSGGAVVAYDRVTPIARIVPFDEAESDDLEVTKPSAPTASLSRIEPMRLRRKVDPLRLLRESRGER